MKCLWLSVDMQQINHTAIWTAHFCWLCIQWYIGHFQRVSITEYKPAIYCKMIKDWGGNQKIKLTCVMLQQLHTYDHILKSWKEHTGNIKYKSTRILLDSTKFTLFSSLYIPYSAAEWPIPTLLPTPQLWKISIFLPSLFNVRPTEHPQNF